jgi:hypothetical protein
MNYTNPNTGKGWTDAEETTFAAIMRIGRGRLSRIQAIQLFFRCKKNHARALKMAQDNYGLSDVQMAAYERTKAARLARLAQARQRRSLNRQFHQPECPA